MKKATIYLSLLLILATACKKYEEGPTISLRSKEKRLCQTWELHEFTKDGEPAGVSHLKYKWQFHKDGVFILFRSNNDSGSWETEELSSKWKWDADKDKLEVEAINAPNFWTSYEIKKLKYKELVLERTDYEGKLLRYVFWPE